MEITACILLAEGTFVVSYIDDLLMFSCLENMTKTFKAIMKKHLALNDLGIQSNFIKLMSF